MALSSLPAVSCQPAPLSWNEACLARKFQVVFFNIYTLLSPVCIFITKFYIAVDPLVSAQRCLDHPELLFLSNQYCSIAWQTASLSFKASPPLSWNSFIKRAASPGEKSHKSRWNLAFFLFIVSLCHQVQQIFLFLCKSCFFFFFLAFSFAHFSFFMTVLQSPLLSSLLYLGWEALSLTLLFFFLVFEASFACIITNGLLAFS